MEAQNNTINPEDQGPADLDRERAYKVLLADGYFRLQARCNKAFKPAAGNVIQYLVYCSGLRTNLSGGWFWQTVAELEEGTGQDKYQQRRSLKRLV